MFSNIGGKIKGLVVIIFIIEVIICIIAGCVMISTGDDGFAFLGLIVMILGTLIAWISSWVLYGYGEIIVKLTEIERNTRGGAAYTAPQTSDDPDRINRLKSLYTQGLISAEEYQKALSK